MTPSSDSSRLRVGVLGATGAVGQTFVSLLDGHPLFEITALAASARSAGKPYREAANWVGSSEIPEAVAEMVVQEAAPPLACDLVFSGLDNTVAGEIEAQFARAGYPVVSNAKNYRLDPAVPLLIPEVNPDHTALIERQEWGEGGARAGTREGGRLFDDGFAAQSRTGFIVTNPNCSTVGLVMALKPLDEAFGVEAAHVVTMQALSGAGYPGVPSLDIVGNVVPFIGGEEEKMAVESRKLLGRMVGGEVAYSDVVVSAQCNRVPVLDGHTECVSVRLKRKASPEDVAEALRTWAGPLAGMGLPTAPEQPVRVHDDPRHPQPRRHARAGGGMEVGVGRIQPCPVLGVKFVVLSHNTIRGAAGGAILNAELLLQQGRLKGRREAEAAAA